MFKAYFYLSKEAIRDALKVVEQEALSKFDDKASNPVSSAPFFAGMEPPRPGEDPFRKTELNESLELNKDMGPIMESMYQDAIEQLADRIFEAADTDKDGKISFAEFKLLAEKDPNMLQWLEALGSVF